MGWSFGRNRRKAAFSLAKELIDRQEDGETVDYPKEFYWARRKIAAHIGEDVRAKREGVLADDRLYLIQGRREWDGFFVMPGWVWTRTGGCRRGHATAAAIWRCICPKPG